VSGHVLVCGSINVDLVVRVDRLPTEGETIAGGTYAEHGGGKGANQAVAAARAGVRSTLAGAVGDDEHGRGALRDLRVDGVDVAAVAVLPGVATGVAAIVVDAAGRNQIAVASGANARVDAALVRERIAALRPDVLLVNHELDDAVNAAAVAHAQAVGARIVLNPAPARPLAEAIVAAGPILTPNAEEARALTGAADPADAARALLARTGAPVVVTLGAAGALLVTPDGAAETLPAPRVDAVDTTGAGDVLSGTLAAGLAAGRPVREAVVAAVAAAARSVTAPGARGQSVSGSSAEIPRQIA
jgi:ribokinase